ncbi:MAG: 2-oxo acid dehydrogenase subunit E2 [Clostridiales bacterium]|nr:2-oxo acid dehydrogenase subunit E2 [Clostridiales bacterium]
MSQSSLETAPVSQIVEVDATELLRMRKRLNEGWEKSEHITVTAFILRAMAIAVNEHERFRMQLSAGGDSFILKDAINIGVAVGTADGLTVPVLRDAYLKPIDKISAETTEMAQKAREGKLAPESYQGGVITLTNMGMFGVTAFTPIINQPEASILGMGAPAERVVLEEGVPKSRSFMFQSLTYDHRIINGTEAAQFQKRVKDLLEAPELLL